MFLATGVPSFCAVLHNCKHLFNKSLSPCNNSIIASLQCFHDIHIMPYALFVYIFFYRCVRMYLHGLPTIGNWGPECHKQMTFEDSQPESEDLFRSSDSTALILDFFGVPKRLF